MQIIRYEDGKVGFWGRRMIEKPVWTERLKKFILLVQKFLCDGSILDFKITDKRGRRYIPSIFANKPNSQPEIYIFDVIFWKEKSVSELLLKKKKNA